MSGMGIVTKVINKDKKKQEEQERKGWERNLLIGAQIPKAKKKKRLREEEWGVSRCTEFGFFYSNGYKRGWEERETERKREKKE